MSVDDKLLGTFFSVVAILIGCFLIVAGILAARELWR